MVRKKREDILTRSAPAEPVIERDDLADVAPHRLQVIGIPELRIGTEGFLSRLIPGMSASEK
jgi:hypothetical protein